MAEPERLVAEIPPELKQIVDADRRDNREVVEAALWREFGGEKRSAIERRIEEKERRIEAILDEKEEREREINEHRNELQALQDKLDQVEEEQQTRQEEILDEVTTHFGVKHFKSINEPVVDATDEQLEPYAEDLDMSLDELKDHIITEAIDD